MRWGPKNALCTSARVEALSIGGLTLAHVQVGLGECWKV